jgi:hypothetical protein
VLPRGTFCDLDTRASADFALLHIYFHRLGRLSEYNLRSRYSDANSLYLSLFSDPGTFSLDVVEVFSRDRRVLTVVLSGCK